MTPAERRYLFVESVIGSAIVNAVLNGAIGWGITKGLTEFPVWKTPGVAFDLVATAFGVAFGTSLGAVIQVRLDTARGKISRPEPPPWLAGWVARSPRGILARALVVGVVATVAFGPAALGFLAAAAGESIERFHFVALKAGFSAVEGAIVTPFILLATIAHAVGAPRGRG